MIKLGRIKFNVKDYRRQEEICCSHEKAQITPSKGEKLEDCLQSDITPQKQLDASQDSLREEFEEEAVEIDCGVVGPTSAPDIQCKVCWENHTSAANPLLNSCAC